jgi:hypothetical protein
VRNMKRKFNSSLSRHLWLVNVTAVLRRYSPNEEEAEHDIRDDVD